MNEKAYAIVSQVQKATNIDELIYVSLIEPSFLVGCPEVGEWLANNMHWLKSYISFTDDDISHNKQWSDQTQGIRFSILTDYWYTHPRDTFYTIVSEAYSLTLMQQNKSI